MIFLISSRMLNIHVFNVSLQRCEDYDSPGEEEQGQELAAEQGDLPAGQVRILVAFFCLLFTLYSPSMVALMFTDCFFACSVFFSSPNYFI